MRSVSGMATEEADKASSSSCSGVTAARKMSPRAKVGFARRMAAGVAAGKAIAASAGSCGAKCGPAAVCCRLPVGVPPASALSGTTDFGAGSAVIASAAARPPDAAAPAAPGYGPMALSQRARKTLRSPSAMIPSRDRSPSSTLVPAPQLLSRMLRS